MVELSGANDPYQHGFPNSVFIIPAIIIVSLSGKNNIYINFLLDNYSFL